MSRGCGACGWSGLIVLAVAACTVESPDNGGTGLNTTSTSGLDTGDVATTIPIPPVTTGSSDAGGSSSGAGSTDTTAGSTGLGDSGTTAADSTDGGDTTTDDGGESSSSDSGTGVGWDVTWCILQFPDEVIEPVGTTFTVYGRVFAEGLTDQTGATDPDPLLVAELGWGPDGSDPSMGDEGAWLWTPADPNFGYGPGAPDYSAVNDEYWGELTIGVAGTHDFAVRVSGDGGLTWSYCDFDGLTTGGYTPDQAGDAQIGG